jgi:GNAT superfamily N-acetyltransferase
MISLDSITIRTIILPGDLGYVIHRHGKLYAEEYNYGVAFEMYVAKGICDFYESYDPEKDRAWIFEYKNILIGFILLEHRNNDTAQLRYFFVEKEYRGIGLGKKLMQLFTDFLTERGYTECYLWTTHELETAAALYTKHGFMLSEEKDSAAFGKKLKERKYTLKINTKL